MAFLLRVTRFRLNFTLPKNLHSATSTALQGSRVRFMSTTRQQFSTMEVSAQQFMRTSGARDAVWVHTDPYSNRPTFSKLDKDLETDVCIVGAGISGVSIAYELVKKGTQVTLLEAREILSGETGRTSGHLASDLDDDYREIAQKFGEKGAKIAAESHQWAVHHIGDIVKELNIDCEYRQFKGYDFSQFQYGTKEHDDDIADLKEEVAYAKKLGLQAEFIPGHKIPGWDGKPDQRDCAVFGGQATFHPTKYVNGLLRYLQKQPNFQCFTHTRARAIDEKGLHVPVVNVHLGDKRCKIETEGGNTVHCNHAVEATVIPLQALSVVAEMEYDRTYCIAIRIPKGTVEDCSFYDTAEEYKYVRLTECDENDDYMVVGGCDHAVGQEDEQDQRYQELENWTRERFTKAGSVDYKWSGQIIEPLDMMAFIGRNSGNDRKYIVTGDSGNGLTHGVIAGRIISNLILGQAEPWEEVYTPKRKASLIKQGATIAKHVVDVNSQYKRFLQSDIKDIEDLPRGCGGVLNPATKTPQAVYKDENGKVHKYSAICPHLGGVVCWNDSEKSWDCPVHGSRFSTEGIAICGPTNRDLGKATEFP